MKYDELTDREKAVLGSFDSRRRAYLASQSRIARDADIPTQMAFYATQVKPILDSLDPDELIPNSTDYDLAQPLTVAEHLHIQGIVESQITLLGQERPLILKAIGPGNA